MTGYDGTAISVPGVFYYLLRNPRVTKILQAEVSAADIAGDLASSQESTGAGNVVPFPAANMLVYLDVVTNESLRMHSAAGVLLERVTPP